MMLKLNLNGVERARAGAFSRQPPARKNNHFLLENQWYQRKN